MHQNGSASLCGQGGKAQSGQREPDTDTRLRLSARVAQRLVGCTRARIAASPRSVSTNRIPWTRRIENMRRSGPPSSCQRSIHQGRSWRRCSMPDQEHAGPIRGGSRPCPHLTIHWHDDRGHSVQHALQLLASNRPRRQLRIALAQLGQHRASGASCPLADNTQQRDARAGVNGPKCSNSPFPRS